MSLLARISRQIEAHLNETRLLSDAAKERLSWAVTHEELDILRAELGALARTQGRDYPDFDEFYLRGVRVLAVRSLEKTVTTGG